MAIGLYLVPLTLRTVTNTEYGIWLTVASFLSWFSFFDIGLGNGLRNKLAEALAGNDQQRAREYISTTYAVLTAIALLLTVLFGMVYRYIPWREVFNAPAEVASDLTILVPAVFLLFMVQFVLQLIITVLLADQRPAITNLISLGGTVLTLGGVWAIQQLHQGSVLTLGVVFMLSPVIVLWCTHLYQYRTTYRNIAPAWRYVRTHLAASLTSIGGQF
ncbi:hypothetical protein HUU42_01940, partial [bacterium]|nr:hypothetical protein [bacterium]